MSPFGTKAEIQIAAGEIAVMVNLATREFTNPKFGGVSLRIEQEPSMSIARRFFVDDSGATAIEYGLICSLVFLVVVGSIQTFAGKTVTMYNNIAGKL